MVWIFRRTDDVSKLSESFLLYSSYEWNIDSLTRTYFSQGWQHSKSDNPGTCPIIFFSEKSANLGTCSRIWQHGIGQLRFITYSFFGKRKSNMVRQFERKREIMFPSWPVTAHVLVLFFSKTFLDWYDGESCEIVVDTLLKLIVDTLLIFCRSGRVWPATDSRYVVVQL